MNKLDFERTIAYTKKDLKVFNLNDLVLNINVTESFYDKKISGEMSLILSELTQNCAEKGAKKIIVTLTDNSLRVEDDFVEENPSETLKFLNKILTSRKSGHTTKKELRKSQGFGKGDLGGYGISNIVLPTIEEVNGTLRYVVTNDNRIVAEASWE